MRFVLAPLAIAFVASCGGSKPHETPKTESPPPAGMVYKDMNHDQRMYFMEHEVLPQMKTLFAAYDPKFSKMNCNTCHGDGSHDGTFKMPNPQLHSLPGTEEAFMEWVSKDADAAKMSKFMAEQVEPKMAELLHMKAFDPETKSGDFSCGNCHTLKN